MTFGLAAQQPPATPPIHAKAAHRLVIKNAMVIYGNAKPPYGPVDIVVQDGLISYIGPADAAPSASARDSDDAAIVGHGDRRHRQVRDAGHRQRAHALARGAAAGHPAADPVRAEPVSRRRRHHRARGRRRLRQVEALAGREQRAHDHRAAHPGLSVRQQGTHRIAGRDPRLDPRHQAEGRRRPEDHRHGSRSARSDHGRSAQARACGRRRTSRSRRRPRRTTPSSASPRSSTSTASPTRR